MNVSLPNLRSASTGVGGGGAYGGVPAQIGVPASEWSQAQTAVPSLPGLTNSASSSIQDMLSGKLSEGTMKLLQDKAAQFGVASGMPGLSGLSLQNLMQNIGLTSEQLNQQGVQDYLGFLTGVSKTQTDPALAAEIASRNAAMAAAPNPELAALQQEELFNKYYNSAPSGATSSEPWWQQANPGGFASGILIGGRQVTPQQLAQMGGV